jgi:hypothetical protein
MLVHFTYMIPSREDGLWSWEDYGCLNVSERSDRQIAPSYVVDGEEYAAFVDWCQMTMSQDPLPVHIHLAR